MSQNRIFCHFHAQGFMRKTVIFIVLISVLWSCSILPKPRIQQGIIGQVRWVEGNLMPSIGDTTYADRVKGVAVQRDIYVYKAVKHDNVIRAEGSLIKNVQGELVLRMKTDKKGNFRAELLPGKYSIFTMEKEGFFANTFDGDGFINPVTVRVGEFTELQILINYKAYY